MHCKIDERLVGCPRHERYVTCCTCVRPNVAFLFYRSCFHLADSYVETMQAQQLADSARNPSLLSVPEAVARYGILQRITGELGLVLFT